MQIRHIGRRRAFLLSEDLHAIRDMAHDENHHGDKKKKKTVGEAVGGNHLGTCAEGRGKGTSGEGAIPGRQIGGMT